MNNAVVNFLILLLLLQPNGTKLPDILRVAVLPVIDLNLCRKAYGEETQEGKSLSENMFCAGGSVNGQATYQVSTPIQPNNFGVIHFI